MEVDLGLSDIVLDGDPVPHPKWGAQPAQFLAHVCCGQTVGWIKKPLGTEVGLGPGHVALDGDPAPPRKGAHQPQLLGPCLLWSNGRPSQQLLTYLSTQALQ